MQREKGKELLRETVKRLDERLWHQLEQVWQLAEEGIQDAQRSKDGHQQGTPHCRAVEENLAALIPDDWKGTQFTATDIFALSTAAALHDAGKAGDLPDGGQPDGGNGGGDDAGSGADNSTEPDNGGGCSTTGGPAAGLAWLGLSLVGLIRRRRA